MPVLISFKGRILHLTEFHKPAKEYMMKWSEQITAATISKNCILPWTSCVPSNVWKALRDTDLEPIQWSWKSRNDSFVPIVTDEEPGPSDLSKIVPCTCKEMCDKCCSCRKVGLTCMSSCKECHGFFCTNLEQIEETCNNDDSNKSDDTRHFPESCS